MVVIKAKKVPASDITITADEILTRFCIQFPQYTLAQAKQLPLKRILFMLKVARKVHAERMIDFLNIMASVQSGKKGNVDTVLSYFKRIIEE